MLTIRNVGGNLLFVHVAVTYLITFLICGLVYIHWREMVRLRRDWFRSPEYLQSFYARTLAILHVPKENKSDEGLRQLFAGLRVPYPTTSVHIGRKVGQLPDLIEYHNTTVRELEEVLVKYLRNGRLGKKRPTIRVGGTCGCGGMRRDAIDFYTAKLRRTEAAIEEYRNRVDTHKAENYGFASMAAVPYAHVVAKILQGKHPKGTDITLAPNPKDIVRSLLNHFFFIGILMLNLIDMEQHEQIRLRACTQKDERVHLAGRGLFFQHGSSPCHISSCQPRLTHDLCPLPPRMVGRLWVDICSR